MMAVICFYSVSQGLNIEYIPGRPLTLELVSPGSPRPWPLPSGLHHRLRVLLLRHDLLWIRRERYRRRARNHHHGQRLRARPRGEAGWQSLMALQFVFVVKPTWPIQDGNQKTKTKL